MSKTWYNRNYLVRFCAENQITLLKDYDSARETIIIAKCIMCDNEMVNKPFRAFVSFKNFGCEEHKKIISIEKRANTNLEIRGVEYPLQDEELEQKRKNTTLERYGVEHPIKKFSKKV
jgi:hypothetical protein